MKVDFHDAVGKMREFFLKEGFREVHTQHRLSILAACEDPFNLTTFNYSGQIWPMSQTGQMWLEHELLKNPEWKGCFCVSTSYRNEPDPIPGRHDLTFPMMEFELHGGMNALRDLEVRLLDWLGFPEGLKDDYLNVAKEYSGAGDVVDAINAEGECAWVNYELTADDEGRIWHDKGPVFFLENFPEYTDPFWNMKRDGDVARKIDVLLYGMETIGSAERSCDVEMMRESFMTIKDGAYAKTLFAQFGKDRVLKELNDFLKHDFFPRSGGGIGMTRMVRALNLLEESR